MQYETWQYLPFILAKLLMSLSTIEGDIKRVVRLAGIDSSVLAELLMSFCYLFLIFT